MAQLDSAGMDSPYLTVEEVADFLRMNQQTVRNWIDRGELPAVRVGSRRVRVRRSDLEAFLEASSNVSRGAATGESEQRLRADLGQALERARTGLDGSDAELAGALRALAVSSMRLA